MIAPIQNAGSQAGVSDHPLRRSLRARLLISTATATVLLFAVACALIYLGVRTSLLAEFDETLLTQARALAAATEWHGKTVQMEIQAVNIPEFQNPRRGDFFEVWIPDGSVAVRSPSLAQRDLPKIDPGDDPDRPHAVTLPDGRPGRILGMTFQANREVGGNEADERPGGVVTLVLARDTRYVDRSLRHLLELLAGVCVVATLAAVVVMGVVVRRGLRPLGALASRIAAIGDEDLADRIALRETPMSCSRWSIG